MDPNMSRKGEPDPSQIVEYLRITLHEDMSIQDQPVEILDKQERVLRG